MLSYQKHGVHELRSHYVGDKWNKASIPLRILSNHRFPSKLYKGEDICIGCSFIGNITDVLPFLIEGDINYANIEMTNY